MKKHVREPSWIDNLVTHIHLTPFFSSTLQKRVFQGLKTAVFNFFIVIKFIA